IDEPRQVALSLLLGSTRSKRLDRASSRRARSTAGRPVPDRDSAPSSASSPRTAQGIPNNDNVPPARATAGFPLALPPAPIPAARTRSPRTPEAQAGSLAD